jgi:vacuolar-type H+-ATPase subunit B/Vma2
MSLQSLEQLTDQIGKAINQDIDQTNADEVMGKLNELSALQSTSSHTMALAEMVYNQKIMDLVKDSEYSKLSATDKKYIFLGKAKMEAYYVTFSERLSRSLSHRLDALRSILSFIKAEMEHLNSQTH